jgi:hypothetical protein
LGWTALKTVTGHVRFAPDDTCQWSITANMQVERPLRGALRMMELVPGRLPKWPDWLGAGFVTASTLGWDFAQAMKGVGSMYDQATEPGPDGEGLFEDLLDGIRDDPEGVQIDLRTELFARLGPELLSVEDEVPATQDSPAERRSLYVAAVPDEAKMLETLTRFYKDDEKVHHERKGNYEVWWVDETGSLFVESESETDVTVRGLALGGGHLALATEVAALDKIIAPASDLRRLADDAGWSKLLAWTQALATDRTALVSLSRLDEVAAPVYEKARTPPPKKNPPDDKPAESPGVQLGRWFLFGSQGASDSLPYGAAPPFAKWRTALPQASFVMTQTEDGWSICFGALAPGPAK